MVLIFSVIIFFPENFGRHLLIINYMNFINGAGGAN